MTDSSRRSPTNLDAAAPVPDSVASDGGEEEGDVASTRAGAGPDLSHLPEAHRDTVRRLHDRIQRAASLIEDLRAENKRLRRRVDELEARPALPDDQTILALDDNPEALRDRITDFIDSIDAYLDATDPEASDPDAPAEEA